MELAAPKLPSHRAGFRAGHSRGNRSGFGSSPAGGLGWTVDGLSGKAIPQTVAEVNAMIAAAGVSLGAPTSIRRCQETSGNLIDYGTAGKDLVASSAPAPQYDQSTTGWASKAVGFNGGTSQRFLLASYGNSAAVSQLVIALICFQATPAASSQIIGYGSTDNTSVTSHSAGTMAVRYRQGANILNGTTVYGTNVVFPVVLWRDLDVDGGGASPRARLFTHDDRLAITFGASTGTNFAYGAIGAVASQIKMHHAIEWHGLVAETSEAAIKGFLQIGGWTVAWTPV